MFSVILIEPETSENIGFVARCMKNFDFNSLVIINPKCSLDKANKTAMHAKDILSKAKVKDISFIKKYDYLIGTTAILGTDNNIPRNAINPEEFSLKIKEMDLKRLKVGLMIGREGTGLRNGEVSLCDMIVTIPASRKYPTLNISHACVILFYEIFKRMQDKKSNSHINFATKKEKDVINDYFQSILDSIDFETPEKKDTQKKVWKKIFGKAVLTKKEAFSVMGLFRRLIR